MSQHIFRKKLSIVSLTSLWVVVSCFLSLSLHAQHSHELDTIKFNSLSQQNGLSLNSVNAVIQDSRGFLWIATENGLNRFDGYEFVVYEHIPFDKTSLSHNEVVTLLEDDNGFIWLGTEGGGLNRFDPTAETFIHYTNQYNQEINWDALSDEDEIPLDDISSSAEYTVNGLETDRISHNVIHSLAQDKEGHLWIGTEGGGLNRLNQQTGLFTHYTAVGNNNSLCDNEIKALVIDQQRIIWAGTESGLARYDPQTDQFTCYKHHNEQPTSLSHNEISTLVLDNNNNLWVGTEEGGLNFFNRQSDTFTRYMHDKTVAGSISSNAIESLLFDHNNQLWVATENGLNLFNAHSQTFYHFHYQASAKATLSSNKLSTLWLDNANNLWIGTKNAGLNYVDLKPRKFPSSSQSPTEEHSWSGYTVNAVYQDHLNHLWVGTETEGLFEQQSDGVIHHYNTSNNNSGLGNNDITAIAEDGNNTLWLGTDDGGLYKFNRKGHNFESIALTGDKHAITAMHLGKSQQLWVSIGIGVLITISANESSIQYHALSMTHPDGTVLGDITSIVELADRSLWLATKDAGLIHYNPQTGRTSAIQHNLNNPNSLSTNMVSAVVAIKESDLWIGTHQGLNHYNLDTGLFTLYLKEHGLPSNFISNVVIDNDENLWLTTNRGITRFAPNALTFSNFDRDDGLLNDYFTAGASFINKQGKLLFGGSKGVDSFHPETVVGNPFPPKIQVTEFQLMNKPVTPLHSDVLTQAIGATDAIALNYRQSMFAFEFSALDFTIAKKNQYAYRLVGFDKAWQFVGPRRYASYTNIPPGKYRFEVKGTNNDGLWTTKPVAINIEQHAAPWQTWWAKLVYLLAALSLLALLVFLRFRHERNQLIVEQKKEEARFLKECFDKEQRFTADVAHELRTPIAELRTMAEVALKWPGDPAQALPFYQDTLDATLQMQQMVNNLLALVRADLGIASIHLSAVDINDELQRCWHNYSEQANSKQLNLSANFSRFTAIITSATEFRLILNNVLSNAIEYSPEHATIDVNLSGDDTGFYCLSVSNPMIGVLTEQDLNDMFDRMWRKDAARSSENHAGLGMSLIKSYAQMLSLTVKVDVNEKQVFRICIGNIQVD